MKEVIIIGGGAAGIIASIAAARIGHSVKLIEKNEKLGKKLFITGKGRCNLTNASEIDVILNNIVTNRKFMYSSLYTFDNQAIVDLIEENGCKCKIERGNRVFPISDHSSDVIKALTNELKKSKVDISLNTKVTDIITSNSVVEGVVIEQAGNKKKLMADAIIVCTGGLSYASTGSTGDGYKFVSRLGHNIIETKPSLVPFCIEEKWVKKLQGLSLKNVNLQLIVNGKKIFDEFGEMLFTHFGISGPLVISASSYYVACKNIKKVELYIDLKPALSIEQLDVRLIREFTENSNKQFKNVVTSLFPIKMVPIMIELSGINPEKKANEISKMERCEFIKLIKSLPLTIEGIRGFEEAIITKGGIDVKNINPHTMESKLVSGLFFAGEVIDVDALTGGYNLQVAWSSGYLAGISV